MYPLKAATGSLKTTVTKARTAHRVRTIKTDTSDPPKQVFRWPTPYTTFTCPPIILGFLTGKGRATNRRTTKKPSGLGDSLRTLGTRPTVSQKLE